jgi:outer membrane protein OmpA-like peptidoglycan-associated protein
MIRKMLLAALAAALVTSAAAQAATPSFVVFFPEWSGALDDAAQAVLHQAAAIAAHDPSKRLTVTGYADNKGSQAANQDLSQLRAQVVVDALLADGVTQAQISTGPSGQLPASGVIGRRVEIVVTSGH